MRKKTTFLLILITILLIPTLHQTPFMPVAQASPPTIWHVPGDFPTIQEAIDASSPGDTIQVGAGTYYEHLSMSKSNLTVIGENPLNTIIDGNQTSSVIFLTAKNVTVTGFKIQNGFFGINMVQADNCTITNNVITNMTEEGIPFLKSAGMRISESSNNTIANNTVTSNDGYGIENMLNSDENTIANNTVADNKYGISIDNSRYTTLQNNTLTNNTYNFGVQGGGYPQEFIHNIDMSNTIDGKPIVYLTNQTDLTINLATYPALGYLGVVDSNNITIENLNISNNQQGILLASTINSSIKNTNLLNNFFGIEVIYSNLNIIERNQIESNQEEQTGAIHLLKAESNTVTNNRATLNHKGIHLVDYSTNNTVAENTLIDNLYGMYVEVFASWNNIYHNNFINNAEQVSNSWSNNTWDNGYPSGGNYWSDYTGEDLNDDGIGDNPYIIDPNNQDSYPLMNPVGEEESTNIAITNVTADPTEAYRGETVNISVTIANQGLSPQIFNVTAYYDGNSIGTQTVTNLAPSTEITIIFNWNTTTVTPQNYTIKAEATQVPGETNLNDNTYIDGTVKIKIPGNVNDDGIVNILDLAIVAKAYMAEEGDPDYDPELDLNHDGIIDIRDLSIIGRNYGNTY